MKRLITQLLAAGLLVGCNQTVPVETRSPSQAIEALGFDAIALPTTAYGPGALVTSLRGEGLRSPLKLTYLCAPQYTNAPPPSVDAAASSDASREFSGTFKLDIAGMSALGIGAAAGYVESISIKFDNVKVEQLGFDELSSVRAGLGPVCRGIVEEFSKKGIAYQTKQALRADVVYTASFKKDASAEVKGLAIEALKAAFGGSVQAGSGASLRGNGLYYGLLLTRI
jgi:hypothetical protein